MVKLGATEDGARQALAATTTRVAGRARIENTAQGSRLVVDDDFEGAWRRIGLALDRSGFSVIERDQAKGLFFVRVASQDTTPKKEKSWLSWLKFWPDSPQPAAQGYRVLVNPAKGETVVSVQSAGGGPGGRTDNSDTLLRMLRDQLT
jgi:outer membrane protein assembly factor BamC